MACATSIVKTIVFVFNFLCAFVGVALLTIGAVTLDQLNKGGSFVNAYYTKAPILVLSLGVVIFLISFLGCCGACRDSSCLLTTYSVILLLFFVIQLAIGIFAYVAVNDAESDIKKEITDVMTSEMSKYKPGTVIAESIDGLQTNFQCCGTTGEMSWKNLNPSLDPPDSCCKNTKGCTEKWSQGCVQVLADVIQKYGQIIFWVAIGISATELVGAIFGFCLASSLKNDHRRGYT